MKILPWWRVFVCGHTQSGKSYFTKFLVRKVPQYLVYDAKGEYEGFGAVASSLESLERLFLNGCRRVVYRPQDLREEHFDMVCKFVYEHLRNIVFVVDEVHNFCSPSKITPWFKRVITQGQGEPRRIGVWAISQRPANVHWDVKGNASLLVVFNLARIDAEAISRETDIPEVEIRALPLRHFYVYFRMFPVEERSRRCLPLGS